MLTIQRPLSSLPSSTQTTYATTNRQCSSPIDISELLHLLTEMLTISRIANYSDWSLQDCDPASTPSCFIMNCTTYYPEQLRIWQQNAHKSQLV